VVTFPQVSPTKLCINLASPTFYMSTHLILLDFITLIICSEHYRSSLCSFLHSPVISSSWSQIFSTPYYQIPTALFPPSMWATRFHTHKRSKMKVLYILIFVFFGRQISEQNKSKYHRKFILPLITPGIEICLLRLVQNI